VSRIEYKLDEEIGIRDYLIGCQMVKALLHIQSLREIGKHDDCQNFIHALLILDVLVFFSPQE
jgi:hypothetical protein